MNWSSFWTACGGFFAVVAVIVALWLAKYAQKKKLKLQFSDNVKISTGMGQKTGELVSLNVTNVGNRTVVLARWGIQLKGDYKLLIVPNLPMESLPVPFQNSFAREFPYSLDIEHEVTLYYEKCKFLKAISESCQNNEIEPEQKIIFFVTDSTGKEYCVKSQKKAKEYCAIVNETKKVMQE